MIFRLPFSLNSNECRAHVLTSAPLKLLLAAAVAGADGEMAFGRIQAFARISAADAPAVAIPALVVPAVALEQDDAAAVASFAARHVEAALVLADGTALRIPAEQLVRLPVAAVAYQAAAVVAVDVEAFAALGANQPVGIALGAGAAMAWPARVYRYLLGQVNAAGGQQQRHQNG